MLGQFQVVLKFGVDVQKGLANPVQQLLGFTEMLRIFRVDTSMLIYLFQILRDKDPFLKYSHICIQYRHTLLVKERENKNTSHNKTGGVSYIYQQKYYIMSV